MMSAGTGMLLALLMLEVGSRLKEGGRPEKLEVGGRLEKLEVGGRASHEDG